MECWASLISKLMNTLLGLWIFGHLFSCPQTDHYDHNFHTYVTACCTWPPLWHVPSNHAIFCNNSVWSSEHIIILPIHFLYAELEEAQAGIKISRRNINNLRYADDTTFMAESEELKSLLMKMKEEWKSCPKAQHSED